MLITGHRGASGTQPENSLAAFLQAMKDGADAIELDIHQCKSGEMVVIHDNTLDRTTNGSGEVKNMTLDELRHVSQKNGEPLLTLDEVLENLKGTRRDGGNPTVFIEIKSRGARATASTIRNAVETQGYSYEQLPVIGFNPKQVGLVKAANPKVEIGLSMSASRPAHEQKMLIPLAKSLRAAAINPEHSMVTPELVERAHAAGLKVNTWTVNEHADLKRVTEAGVDAVMSDFPERARLVAKAVRNPVQQQQQQAQR